MEKNSIINFTNLQNQVTISNHVICVNFLGDFAWIAKIKQQPGIIRKTVNLKVNCEDLCGCNEIRKCVVNLDPGLGHNELLSP